MVASVALLGGCTVASRLLSKGPASTSSSAGAALTQLPDDGMTSPTHEKYVGQIVFSPQQIDAKAPDESQLYAEFSADELIYGRAYLPRSIENEPVFAAGADKPSRNLGRGFEVRLTVDGVPHSARLERGTVRTDRRATTTQQVWPHPAPTDEPTSTAWVELVNQLAPGRHEIRVELWPVEGSFTARAPLATGTVTLHKTADARIGIGRTARDLKAGMTDPALVRELLPIVRAYAKQEGWKETIPDLTIESPAWGEVVRERTRYVVARRVVTWVHLDGGDARGCGAQRVVFEQRVKAGSPSGEIYVKEPGPRQTFDCAPLQPAADRWAGRDRKRPTPTGQAVAVAKPATPSPAQRVEPAPTPTTTPATKPATVTVAAVEPAPAEPVATVTAAASPARTGPGRVSIGLGLAANALDAQGVATYGNLGLHLGRVEVGAGATWPLNALGYARVNLLSGRFELSPMVTATMLAEMDETTTFAIAGGVSLAYHLTTGRVRAGLRLDALVSYNPEPSEIALPVLGSTFVRF